MNSPLRVNNVKSQSLSWLIVGLSFVSAIIGLVILARAIAHFTPEPAIVNLTVAIGALIAALLAARQKLWHSSATWLILIAVVAIAGLFSSLFFRDDYSGGSCGEFDWPAGHLHAGYPYSWLDGGICVPPQTSLSEYAQQHPEQAGWYPDFPALLVDLLFWVNTGILGSSFLGLVVKLRKQTRHLAFKKKAA